MCETGSPTSRVRIPETFPRERIVLGRLHLVLRRIDELLADVAALVTTTGDDEAWLRVEEAGRLARRALAAAVRATPPLPLQPPHGDEIMVGQLRIDPALQRQWYGDAEFELTPIQHRLLVVMAGDPQRVFAADELLREVWRRGAERRNAVKTSVSRLRRALVAAGAPPARFLVSLHGVGWALIRPD